MIREIEELHADRNLAIRERNDLRRQLDALTRPIDGVDELGHISFTPRFRSLGWFEASKDTREMHCERAQAIASRVIGALRSAFIEACGPGDGLYAQFFDRAVASLKIEPAKVERSNLDSIMSAMKPTYELTAVDTRPVVKVGQVWTFDGRRPGTISEIGDGWARLKGTDVSHMTLSADSSPMDKGWRRVSDSPPKRKPFEYPSQKPDSGTRSLMENLNADQTAIRDAIRDINDRLEAGGL